MANNNYMPATRRTSNTGSRPNNDPLNLVKVSTNPLAVQAQETIHILEVQKNCKSDTSKRDGNDAWISTLDDWKSKRKSIQPSSIRSFVNLSSFEEPPNVTTSRVSSKDPLRRDDVDDDGEDKTTKKLEEDVSVSQEQDFDQKSFTKEDYQDFKEKTMDVDGLKAYSEVKPTELSVSKIAISKTIPSTQTFESSSLTSTSLNSSDSTPKEATRRSNTSVLAVERPKSSLVSRNIPKVPLKKTAKNFSSIPESEPIEVSKKKHYVEEEKTAQASVKKFNNIKNFFEQASQNVDSDAKGPKPAVRRGISSAVDPKKRMSLGPGVLERTSRSSVAIANDKEFIIDEHFLDSSKSPLPKFQAKPANKHFQMQESTKSITTPVKSPTKIYSFSTDEENATPVKADISMEDFKGMISLSTSSPSSAKQSQPKQQTHRVDVLDSKTEDEVFTSPVHKVDKTISPRFSDPRGTNKTNITYSDAEDEIVSVKSVSQRIKVTSTDKQVKEPISILKQNVQKSATNMSFNDDETQYKSDITPLSDFSLTSMSPAKVDDDECGRSKDECNHPSDGTFFMETAGVDVNKGRNSSKHEENLNSSVNISMEKFEEFADAKDEVLESAEITKMKENETRFTAADYSDLNSYSAKIDKLLEELKFIPTSSIESKTCEPASKSQVKDGKPVRMNDSEPRKSIETFEAIDGKSCNNARAMANVGHLLEKAFSRGKEMPDVETIDGNPQTMKDNNAIKTAAFPKVPPKPARASSCKISALFPGPSTPSGGKLFKKDEKIESGVDLNTKAAPNLLDISASRAKVELSRRAKRRPPSIKLRSGSLEDFLDSAKIPIVVNIVEDKNGFYPRSSEAQDKKLHQREEESSIDDDDDDDDDKPPSLPSCPPPIMYVHDEAQMIKATESFDRTTTLSLKEAGDADSDEDMLPESSV